MAECVTLNGLRAETPANTVTGPGKLWFNVDEAELRNPAQADPLGAATLNAIEIGATRGGTVFNVTKEMRPIEFDGKKGEVKGLTVKESEQALLTVNFIEVNAKNVASALPGSEIISYANGYTEIVPGSCLLPRHYIDNILIAATHGTRQQPILILLKNVLDMSDFELNIQDRDEVNPAFEFSATYDSADPLNIPYRLFMANEAGFYADITPNPLAVTAGATADLTATILWMLGYNTDIAVTLETTEPLITVAAASTPIVGAAQPSPATITIEVAAGVAAGTYPVTLVLTSGNIVQFFDFDVTVT